MVDKLLIMVYSGFMNKTKEIIIFLLAVVFFTAIPSTFALAYQSAPIAITKAATFVTEKSAKLNGQVNPNEMTDTIQWFEWGISGQNNTLYETKRVRASGSNRNVMVNDTADIIGLAPKTQYFYRQVAENSRGKDFGQTVYFTTMALPPTPPELVIIETKDPKTIAETTAILEGYVSPHGDKATKAWFEWGQMQQLENRTIAKTVPANSGYFDSALTNLTPGTTYFYRIVAENSVGRVYGTARMFSTKGTPPPSEAPISQVLPSSPYGGDNTARPTTSSGASAAGSSNGLPGSSTANRPGDFFGLFSKKPASTGATSGSNTTQSTQTASVAEASGPITSIWNTLMGGSKSNVVIEKVGSTDVPAHSPVEYRIAYHYREPSVASDAMLLIVLPSDVVYIGDNPQH